jgi:hypothetical protein
VKKVYPPLLLLGMEFVVGVQFKPSIILGIEENILSWPGRDATILHIAMGFVILVPVSLANVLHSTLI